MYRAFFILLFLCCNWVAVLSALHNSSIAKKHNEQALQNFRTKDFSTAKNHLQEAYRYSKLEKDTNQLFFAIKGLIKIANLNYDYTHIAELIYEAQKLNLTGEDKRALASYETVFFEGVGEYNKALTSAITFYRMTNKKDTFSLVIALHNIGCIYKEKGDYVLARDYLEQAIFLAKGKYPKKKLLSLKSLAATYITTDPNKALSLYQLALETTNNPMHLQTIYYAKANIFLKLNNNQQASYYYEKAYQINTKRVADIYYQGKAKIQSSNNSYEKAIVFLEKAESFLESKDINPLSIDRYHIKIELAKNFLQANKTENALTSVNQAIQLLALDFEPTKNVLPKDTAVTSLIDFLIAVDLKAQILAASYTNQPNEIANKTTLLNYYDYLNKAINTIRTEYQTEESKYLLAENIQRYHKNAMELCLELYNKSNDNKFIDQAFEFAEKNKAAVLLDAVKGNEAKQIGGLSDEDKKREIKLKIDLAFYQKEYSNAVKQNDNSLRKNNLLNNLQNSRNAYNSFIKKLETKYPEYYQLKYAQNNTNISTLQNNLLPNQQVIFYSQIDSTQFIGFSITKNTTKMVELSIEAKKINNLQLMLTEEAAEKWSENIYDEAQKFAEISFDTYKKILHPLNPNPGKHLVFVTDGFLNGFPFAQLICSPYKNDQQIGQLDYLTLKNPINNDNSTTLYISNLQNNNKTVNKGFLAFAAAYDSSNIKAHYHVVYNQPAKRNSQLVPLNGAIEELKMLDSLYIGQFFNDSLATEHNFKKNAANYSIIHLATHGILDDTDPQNSHLVFTLGNQQLDNNILYPFEISTLNLNAELVVLSACQTGAGKNQMGEGLISLSRAFSYAGAKSLLTTLWEIDDQLTPVFIEQFYANLAKGKTKTEALQASQKYCLKTEKWQHPYYWSSFVMYGNPENIKIPAKNGLPYLTIVLSILGIALISGLVYKIKIKN